MKHVWVIASQNTNGLQKILKTELWDTSEPFAVGTPVRYVVEKTEKGFRLRDLVSHTLKSSAQFFDLDGMRLSFVERDSSAVAKSAFGTDLPAWVQEDAVRSRRLDRKVFSAAISILSLSLVVTTVQKFMYPKVENAPIPQEYVKVVLKAAKVEKVASASGSGSNSKAVAAKAQSLVKGGLNSFLRSGSLLQGAGSSLGTLSKGMPQVGSLSNWKSSGTGAMTVAQVGTGQGFGSGVGNAKVSGQGTSIVALDWKDSKVEEGLTKDEVGRVIHAHMAEIRYCYESAMIHNPGLGGRVLVDFTIAGAGQVTTANVRESTARDSRLEGCLVTKLKTWKFPSPKGNVNVNVSYPFLFKSLGG